MKQSLQQKFKQNTRNKPRIIPYNKTTPSSPINQNYEVQGQYIFDINQKNLKKNYFKKFNVRKMNKTEDSPQKSNQKKSKDKSASYKLTRLIHTNKQTHQNNYQESFLNQNYNSKIKTLMQTLDMEKTKYRPMRLQTNEDKSESIKLKSPYLQKYKFRTIQSKIQKSLTKQENESEILKKYFFMTKFQQEQVSKYEVFYAGQRRIGSIKHFTDNEGNAKICIGDSIIYRYQIKNALGQGSFGQVFKAYDHKKRQQIALKIIKNHPKFNKQARVQIKILQTVLMHDPNSHYNIVKLKHAFFFRGHACLTFQLLQINLYQFLRINHFKGLSIDLIRRIAIQILQALMFFQKFNIIHCDLKPQNILLKQQNKTGIKIIDVGSGTFQQDQIYTYIQSRFYRAPQIILGIKYSAKIDIWSFACILCELYTGYPIFPGQNEEEQIQMLIQIFGVPPQCLIDRGSRSIKFFDGYKPKITANSKGKIRSPNSKSLSKKLKNCENTSFIKFLQKCFKWIPEERLNPNEALLDEWILQGLPLQIRQQHIDIVNSQKF